MDNDESRQLIEPCVDAAMSVTGLVDRHEIVTLLGFVLDTLQDATPKRIVEVGSYCGRTAVAMGLIVKVESPASRVYAIDAGSMSGDAGYNTLDKLRENIAKFGLNEVVEILPMWSTQVVWDGPVDLLLIDGNHGYTDAESDLGCFERFIVLGGHVAFHDYHESWPGIIKFVDEIIASGRYADEGLTGTLRIVRKLV